MISLSLSHTHTLTLTLTLTLSLSLSSILLELVGGGGTMFGEYLLEDVGADGWWGWGHLTSGLVVST